MKCCIKLSVLLFCSIALLASADQQKMKHSGRETRLNGRFKSATGNWCAWTEELSDEDSTELSIACLCAGASGERQAYTCKYTSPGDKLHDCKASCPKLDAVYDEIGILLSGEWCSMLKLMYTPLTLLHV